MRQTVLYHKYRVDSGSSTWIMISASPQMKTSLDRYMKSGKDLGPFGMHVEAIGTALANWRPYIISLTERITKHVSDLLSCLPGQIHSTIS